MIKQVVAFFVILAVCFAAAGLGSAVTTPNIPTWYAGLAKPSWNPPNWLFGPVWTVLYVCMAVAAWLVWRQGGWRPARWPLTLFAVQLALNVAWSCIFFGLHRPGIAFAEILALLTAIAATTVAFWPTSKAAGLLLLPYLGWVLFASVLNFTIWRLNTETPLTFQGDHHETWDAAAFLRDAGRQRRIVVPAGESRGKARVVVHVLGKSARIRSVDLLPAAPGLEYGHHRPRVGGSMIDGLDRPQRALFSLPVSPPPKVAERRGEGGLEVRCV